MNISNLKDIQLSKEDCNNLEKVLKYFESLDTSGDINSAYGVCQLAYSNCSIPWSEVEDRGVIHIIFECWPKYSGSKYYPVPHPDYVGEYRTIAASHAFERLDKWSGDYGKLRKELLKHTIECIKYLLESNNEKYL